MGEMDPSNLIRNLKLPYDFVILQIENWNVEVGEVGNRHVVLVHVDHTHRGSVRQVDNGGHSEIERKGNS